MAWTATVESATRSGGEIAVVVAYTDGATTVRDTYRSRGIPDPDWIPDAVRDRIAALSAQVSYTLPAVGPVTPSPAPPADDPARTAFFRRLDFVPVVSIMVERNIIPANDPDLATFVTYLRNNWKTYLTINT